jgi:hypothetical protein
MKINFYIPCILLCAFLGLSQIAQCDTLTLAQNSKSTYVIALANDAIPAEKTAATQFQKYFSHITGVQLPIKTETDVDATTPQILIGTGQRVKVLLPNQNWDALGKDGIVIKTVGNNLILTGGRPRGALYATYQFLEDVAGCRWWTPTESTIPHKSTFTINSQNVIYVPPFRFRSHLSSATNYHDEFAVVMRENGHHQRQLDERWGGHYSILGFVHTFSKLLPPEKYFQQHPEWYTDPDNHFLPCTATSKMPAAQQTQLCFNAPGVQEELTKQALALIKENPDAGYISISQNDNKDGYCRCAECTQLIKEEGSPSAPLLKFVNAVAEKIHQQYPDFMVETLAYHYSEKPPKAIHPAHNVLIRMAPINADFSQPMDSDKNADVRDNLLAWAKISPQIFIWNYVTNFRDCILPHPNLKNIGGDLRFFAAHHVTGIFEQGDAYTNGVGDFVPLRDWLIGKLMWNPNLDQLQLEDEFLRGYYGNAAPFLRQYLDLMQNSFLKQDKKLSTFNTDYSFLTLDVMNDATRLFQQAAAAVQNDKVLSERVRRECLSLDYSWLKRYTFLKTQSLLKKQDFLGPADPKQATEKFIAAAQHFGIKRYNEHTDFSQLAEKLRAQFATSAPLPEFTQQYPAANVIDIQQGNFRLAHPGTLSNFIDDASASDGKAASTKGITDAWDIQAPLDQFLDSVNTNWHIYAMARVDATPEANLKSIALRSGIYDTTNRKTVADASISINQVAGDTYQKVDLGTHSLNGGMYIWFAPTKNPAVKTIYIDRIILIRE